MPNRFWDKPRGRRRFKNVEEVADPEIVVDTRPEEEPVPVEAEPMPEPVSPGIEELTPVPELEPVWASDIPTPPAMTAAKPVDPSNKDALNTAGLLLVSYLPEETQALIGEASEQLRVPVWQLVLGYTMRIRER